MKLNNKGFAITTVLYGLLIIFVLMTSSYFAVLLAKKNRLERITAEIEKEYYFNLEEDITGTTIYPYFVTKTGKYVFTDGTNMYLYAGNVISNSHGNIVKIYYHGDDGSE